jgi:hypothetical protein
MRTFDESSGNRIDRDLTARLNSAYSIAVVVLVLFATFSPGPTKVTAPGLCPTFCEATAVTKAVVRLYGKASLLAEFERNPQVARGFMAMLTRHILDLRIRLVHPTATAACRPCAAEKNRSVP